jgi:three-Cys-motif partner protein
MDVWVLFPLGVAVNRMLPRQGKKLKDSWVRRLTSIFGTDEWLKLFYGRPGQQHLFGPEDEATKIVDFDALSAFYNDRLRSAFAAVAPNPKRLFNSRNIPLYLLCFAVSNPSPKACGLAMRIAKHILES